MQALLCIVGHFQEVFCYQTQRREQKFLIDIGTLMFHLDILNAYDEIVALRDSGKLVSILGYFFEGKVKG